LKLFPGCLGVDRHPDPCSVRWEVDREAFLTGGHGGISKDVAHYPLCFDRRLLRLIGKIDSKISGESCVPPAPGKYFWIPVMERIVYTGLQDREFFSNFQ